MKKLTETEVRFLWQLVARLRNEARDYIHTELQTRQADALEKLLRSDE